MANATFSVFLSGPWNCPVCVFKLLKIFFSICICLHFVCMCVCVCAVENIKVKLGADTGPPAVMLDHGIR